jgi:hypothetical protein
MALDFGEVLTRAWKLTWKHKILWAFGLVSMLLALLFVPLGFAPMISIFFSEGVPIWIEQPLYIFGFFGIFFLLFLASFFIGALVQAAISLGVLRAEREDEKLIFREVLIASSPYWGRFLGVTSLYTGGIILVMFAYFALQFLVSALTLGLGAICMAPLQLLLYPFMLVAYAWFELALASTVVEELGVFEAARRGWQVFRQNLVPVVLLTLIMYMGVGLVSGFLSLPLIAPLFASLLAGLDSLETGRTVLLISALCTIVYIPILAVFQSVALTFMKSGWLLTYLRLTRNAETGVVVPPGT